MALGSAKFGLLAAAGDTFTSLIAYGGQISQYDHGGTTYRVHTFRGDGTFRIVSGKNEIDYLIVAGGGGGGSWRIRSSIQMPRLSG